MSAPIPYCEESVFVHGPVKSLMLGGQWEVPVSLRPRDWQQRVKPQYVESPKPKVNRYEVMAEEIRNGLVKPPNPKRVVRASNAKAKHGHPKIKITVSLEELAKLIQVQGPEAVAEQFGVRVESIYRKLKEAGVSLPPHLCADCKAECGTRKRCPKCLRKRNNDLHIENRKTRNATQPGHKEKWQKYHADWKKAKRSRAAGASK